MKVPLFTHLEIETMGSCNRVCTTCLRQTQKDDTPTHEGRFPVTSKVGEGTRMSVRTFERVVDQAVDMGFTGTVCLQHFNEPLLDPRLEDFARYVKSKPQIVGELGACTNADLMTPERAKVMDSLFDNLRVSLYMTPERQRPREAWLKTLFSKTRLLFTNGEHIVTHFSPFANLQACLDETRSMPCLGFNHMFMVAYDGNVLHCCDDYSGHFGLGNVNESSVREIWESETHSRLVDDLSKPGGRAKHDYCRDCPRY